jgi:hypothetical protein
MGRSRGGSTSKIHALVDTDGLPVRLAVTPGEAHDNRLAGKYRPVEARTSDMQLHGPIGCSAVASAGNRALRAKCNLLNRFNLIWVVQTPSQIFFAFPSRQISGYSRAVSSRQEGRIAIVTNARRDAVDVAASARKMVAGRDRTRERSTCVQDERRFRLC